MPELSADQRQRLARLRRGFQDERKGVGYFLKLLSERLDTAAGRPAAEVVTDKPATRAHLVSHPGFAELDTDEDGNPLVFLNRYECCASKGDDTWSSACDDVCPDCGRDVSPLTSDWLGPSDPGLIALWKDLPDAGLDLSEADVPPTGELTAQPNGLPPLGGPGSVLVHDGSWRHGGGGRRSGSGWQSRPLDDLRSRGPISQR